MFISYNSYGGMIMILEEYLPSENIVYSWYLLEDSAVDTDEG